MKCNCKKLLGGFWKSPSIKFNKKWIAKMLSEFIASFLFLFFACLSCVWKSRGFIEVPFNIAGSYTLSTHIFVIVSGSHLNPSISLAGCLMNIITWDVMLIYWLLQISGALSGFALLALILPSNATDKSPGLCVTYFKNESFWQSLFLEFCLTFMLAFFYCAIWAKRNENFHDSLPLRVMFVFLSLTIAGWYQTGASLNFARTLAPAIWYLDFKQIYIYLIGSIMGAIVAPIVWKILWDTDDDVEEN